MIHCPECGRQLPDGTRFCPGCGQPCNRRALHVQQRAQMSAAQTIPAEDVTRVMPRAETPLVSQPFQGTVGQQNNRTGVRDIPTAGGGYSAAAAVVTPGKESGKKGPDKKVVIAVIVAVILLIAAIGGVILKTSSDKRAAYDDAHAARQAIFTVDAPKYETGVDSPIPIRIVGTDLDGVQVDEVSYITPDNPVVSLKKGKYTATVAASPLMMRGAMYKIPTDIIELNIGESDLSGDGMNLAFEDANLADVSDNEIDEAYQLAEGADMESGRAKALRDAVLKARQDALDGQAAAEEEESRRKAQEADAKAYDAQRTYQDEYVTMMLPGSWVGNCAGSVGYDGNIFQTNLVVSGGSFVLLSISGVPGDFSTYSVTYVNSATEIWDQAHGASGYSEWELDQAINLQTGGALTRADVLACSSGQEAEALGEQYISSFMEANIGPTISAT